MRPDDFDDFEDEDTEPVTTVFGDRKLTPEHKLTVKKMIRNAIRWQNQQVLFTCRECCFYRPANEKRGRIAKCTLDSNNQLVTQKLMPTQLPECFLYDPLASSFVGVLDLMLALGIGLNAERGWASVVGRIAKRQDRYGYITGVTQRNLDKYGS